MRFRIASEKTVILVEGVGGDQIRGMDVARVLPQFIIGSMIVVCRRGAGRVERQGQGAKVDQDVLRRGPFANRLAELVELGKAGALTD